MWWIIGIIAIFIIVFLLLIVHCAGRSVSDEVQAQLDEDQVKAIEEYSKKK